MKRKCARSRRLRRLLERLEARCLLAGDFTFAVLPDTQHYSDQFPETFEQQTQWIADNLQANNLQFVTHLGDVVQTPGVSQQWQNADAAIDLLDGDLVAEPDGLVPYSVIPGNHDYDVLNSHDGFTQFSSYFGDARYAGRSWYGGSSPDGSNFFQVITAGAFQFLHLGLEWEPRDSSIIWSQGVLDAHQDLPTIVSTHAYLDRDGNHFAGATTPDGRDGEEIFQDLISPNSQIFLVLGGHFAGEEHQTSLNAAGLEVHELATNYQARPNGGDGWLQLLTFEPDLDRIDVTTYSPTLDQFETDSNSQFSLTVDFDVRFEIDAPPTAQWVSPLDNGPQDFDATLHSVLINESQPFLQLQLNDYATGVDDSTVAPATVDLIRDGVPLLEGTDYVFTYDAATDRVTLLPIAPEFGEGRYEILLSSGIDQIADLDGNQMVATTLVAEIDLLLVSPPDSLYFSLRDTTLLPSGLTLETADVAFFDGTSFSTFFDGSDVGLAGLTIDAMVVVSADELLLSFTGSATIPGISSEVDDSDIVSFVATQFGDTTAGAFSLYFDGSDVDLSTSYEDIDALSLLPDGRLVISTRGSVSVAGVVGSDEDLLVFQPLSLGENTAGTWALYFDGSDVSLGGEDVNAVSVFPSGDIYLSLTYSASLPLFPVKDEDVFYFQPTMLGDTTMGTYPPPRFFDGSVQGFGSDVYSIHLPLAGPMNQPPIAENDDANTSEDTPLTIDVLADNGHGIDRDDDGTLVPSTTLAVSGPSSGNLVNHGDGTFDYTPDANFSGTDSFIYTVDDDEGATSNAAIVTIVVSAINDAPVAVDDSVSILQDQVLIVDVLADNGSGADHDVDGTVIPMTAASVTGTSAGGLVNNGDGTFTYTPDPGYFGPDSFTYTVEDDMGAVSNVAIVSITVMRINAVPIAEDDDAVTNEDTPLTIDVLIDNGHGADYDLDGTLVPSTAMEVGGPSNGTLTNHGDGTFGYTPNANFDGIDTFTYTVDDSDGATSNVATVTIVVTEINDAPVAINDAVDVDEDQVLIIDVLADNGGGADFDVDGVLIASTAIAVTGTTDGTLVNNGDGTFTYTPDQGFFGSDGFTYTVQDNDGATSNTASVGIEVSSSSTLYFSLNTAATFPNSLSVKNEDIVAYDGVDFTMLFDGSDVGIHGEAIAAFSVISDTEILMAFGSSADVAGVSQTVTTSDVVKFNATQLGETTAGVFELYFLGGNVGLAGSSEKIDGLEQLEDGRILLSTNGSPSVPGVSARDEDILAFTPTALGQATAGSWELYFDGSQVELGGEDLDAIAVGDDGRVFMSTQSAFAISAVAGDDQDVLAFTPTSLGEVTSGVFDSQLFFDGSLFGLTVQDIRGMDFAPPAGMTSANSLPVGTETSQDSITDPRSISSRFLLPTVSEPENEHRHSSPIAEPDRAVVDSAFASYGRRTVRGDQGAGHAETLLSDDRADEALADLLWDDHWSL